MGLFKSKPSELATELKGFYLLTEAGANCTEETTEQRFNDLKEIRSRLAKAMLEIVKEKEDPAHYDFKQYFNRIEQLHEVYRTGEYWYISPDGLIEKKKVTEPDAKEAFYCLTAMIDIANADSKNFTREGTLPDTIKRKIPALLLEKGKQVHLYTFQPRYLPWFLKFKQRKLFPPAEERSQKALELGFDLCCRGYGAESAAAHAETAAAILQELDALRPKWKKVRPHGYYVKMAVKHGISL